MFWIKRELNVFWRPKVPLNILVQIKPDCGGSLQCVKTTYGLTSLLAGGIHEYLMLLAIMFSGQTYPVLYKLYMDSLQTAEKAN